MLNGEKCRECDTCHVLGAFFVYGKMYAMKLGAAFDMAEYHKTLDNTELAPIAGKPSTVKPSAVEPSAEKPSTVELSAGNPTQLNTNIEETTSSVVADASIKKSI